jgi:acetolactate synthase-1/2/3 large subunit
VKRRATGAHIFFECLRREGVDVVFGYPGGAVIQLYDELIRFPEIRHILVRHEQGAVHAADGYARSTGRVGVCLATSGPGATNLVTGLAAAYLDSIPLVAFTGQVPTRQLGNDAFQEVDILGITRTCTKHNYMVRDTSEVATIVREAFWVAASGRPGPVLVDLPKDVVANTAPMDFPEHIRRRGYTVPGTGHPLQIKRVAAEIKKAQRPVIYAGGGIIHSSADAELRALAESTGTPVTLTLMGLGGFPANHPLYLGMLGMHGSYAANMAVTQCDLLVAVGCRFDDRVTGKIERFAPQAKIIHIDIDPSSISKNVKVDVPIVGDAKTVLAQVLRALKKDPQEHAWDRSAWMTRIQHYQDQHPLRYEPSTETIKPQYVIEELHARTRGEAIVATEVGQNQMWTAQFFGFQSPRTLLSSGGLGAMGFGLPAAIGAQVACPDRTVVDVAGDASIQMNIQELGTAVQYGLPIKIAVLNNRSLGMVRQWQAMFFDGRLSETLLEGQPDFVRLAEAYGAVGLRATRPEEVRPCLERALALPGPVLMDFWVDPLEQVLPIVPPGRGIDEMILDHTAVDAEGSLVSLPA